MTDFRRARSEEQRESRRAAILDTAAAMLSERPVADLSLNELARRVGLAKSNVLRYFDSREAILLELLSARSAEWLAELTAARKPRGSAPNRSRRLAELIADSLQRRPVLCDLLGSQALVLERNVSVEIAVQHKRTWLARIRTLAEVTRNALPELDETQAFKFAGAACLMAGAVWSHAQPAEAMLAAYAANPDLQAMRLDFSAALTELLTTLLTGLLNPHR